jgi:hypothetical protein
MPSKLLVGLSSCQAWEDNGYNDVIRECWLNECAALGIDYKFFHGENSTPGPDIINFNVGDDMEHLTFKHKEQVRWAYKQGYDWLYRCFPDTYCRPERLIRCGFEGHDYHGDFRGEPARPDNFCSGGPGFILSRKAMGVIINADIGDDARSMQADDLWTGKILASCFDAMNLAYFDDHRLINRGACNPGPLRTNEIISSHLSYPGGYRPELMRKKHADWLT